MLLDVSVYVMNRMNEIIFDREQAFVGLTCDSLVLGSSRILPVPCVLECLPCLECSRMPCVLEHVLSDSQVCLFRQNVIFPYCVPLIGLKKSTNVPTTTNSSDISL